MYPMLADVLFYQRKGYLAVTHYHDLVQGSDRAKEHDLKDKKCGVAKTNTLWQEGGVKLIELLFKPLGVNYKTRKGPLYFGSCAYNARQSIREDTQLTHYVTFKLGLDIDSQLPDTTFVNNILKKLLGLKTQCTLVRRGKDHHWIDSVAEESMKMLQYYSAMKFKGGGF